MYCVRLDATPWLRRGFLSFATVCLTAHASAPALSRPAQQSVIDNPRYAAIVLDANSGTALRQANPDSLRHPASLTKIMTLYLLFERIESGKIKLTTPLAVSAEAASQAPTKLGLKPGQFLVVEDAIKALITKSANDAAVVIAEALAGSEDEFAKQMTRKARALGMTRTLYRNASGLPDDEQVTTARDQARLGIEIQDRFPRFYKYFSLSQFTYHGETMRNHNRLLGNVPGIDGIKTGYTRASGFNLVTSVRRGGRHIVAVVLGGATGAQRDAHMRSLIDRHIVEASIKRPDVKVAQAPAEPRTEARAEARPAVQAEARPEPRQEARQESRPMPRIVIVPIIPSPSETVASIIPSMPPAGANEPLNPTVVKTVPLKSATGPMVSSQISAFAAAPELGQAAIEASRLPAPSETQLNAEEDQAPVETVTGNIPAAPVIELGGRPANRPSNTAQGSWAIQVGAFDQESEAQQRLTVARSKAASLLKSANPHTERTIKGDKTLYRARFTGLDRAQAEAACKYLQRNDVGCIALRI